MEVLTLSPTNKCPLKCSHCGPVSGPQESGVLEFNLLCQAITSAKERGCRVVNISGGEPFIVKDLVIQLVDFINKENLISRVTTSAYWAKNLSKTKNELESIKSLDQMMISVTTGHLEYLNINNAINAVEVGMDHNIDCYLSIEGAKNNKLYSSILKAFVERNIPVPRIFETKIIPFGRALESYTEKELYLQQLDDLRGPCPAVNKHVSVHSNGSVTACTSVFAGNSQLLSIGDINAKPANQIFSKPKNKELHHFIETKGPVALKEQLEKKFGLTFRKEYVNICHLCGDLLDHKKAIKSLFSSATKNVD